jgi:hypothetical protein
MNELHHQNTVPVPREIVQTEVKIAKDNLKKQPRCIREPKRTKAKLP